MARLPPTVLPPNVSCSQARLVLVGNEVLLIPLPNTEQATIKQLVKHGRALAKRLPEVDVTVSEEDVRQVAQLAENAPLVQSVNAKAH